MTVLWLLSLVTLFGCSLAFDDWDQFQIVWQDEFDKFDHNNWQHEVTAWGGGVSILIIISIIIITIIITVILFSTFNDVDISLQIIRLMLFSLTHLLISMNIFRLLMFHIGL